MNILVVNPIVYTSETKNIKRVKSIKDTMIYDLCLAFVESGHNTTLYAAEPFKPEQDENYPFQVIWGNCLAKKLFMPHCFPFMPSLISYLRKNNEKIDLIICSEVFSMNTLSTVLVANEKTVIWHELAKHNAMLKKIPSKFWYNVVARIFMGKTRVVPRSEAAREFIRKYCKTTLDVVIDHGVNLEKFPQNQEKENYFVVCSQLIARKRIDGIIHKFKVYLDQVDKTARLYIIGDGDQEKTLKEIVSTLEIEENVIFTGRLSHQQMLPYLYKAKALLINTEKDNSMISIVESIAVATPILTTDVPLNCKYIKENNLGITGEWDWIDLKHIVSDNDKYIMNCSEYRHKLSTFYKVKQFLDIKKRN